MASRLSFSFLSLLIPTFCLAADLTMVVGDQRDLPLRGSGMTITVTSPQVIRAKVTAGRLHLAAKKPGHSRVSLGNGKTAYSIMVYSQKVADAKLHFDKMIIPAWAATKTKRATPEIDDIEIEIQPDKLVVLGFVNELKIWRRLQELRRQFKNTVIIKARPSEALAPLLQKTITESLSQRSISSAVVSMREDQLYIDQHGKEKEQRKAVEEVAEDWGIESQESTQNVELRPMVEVEISIAEVKKNFFRTLGLKAPGVYSATVLPAGDLSSASTTFNPIGAELHAGFDSGSGRVIANPKLLCRSGETAHFVAGGEIPIKIASWKTSDIFWKRYGVILDITPLADAQNGISTKLVTEISLIDESHKVEGIPGFLTNRIETHFDLQGSKTIALSGLIKSELGRTSSGIPGLADIPILGELFKSRDYRDNRTELVIFVTPRVVHPDDAPAAAPKKFFDETED